MIILICQAEDDVLDAIVANLKAKGCKDIAVATESIVDVEAEIIESNLKPPFMENILEIVPQPIFEDFITLDNCKKLQNNLQALLPTPIINNHKNYKKSHLTKKLC